jgi:copper homeostasis protein CutC
MKNKLNNFLIIVITATSLFACSNLSTEVEKKLNELQNKTESLDSLINNEVGKVLTLDSLVNKENDKVKKLDSLINKSSSKLDSFSNNKLKLIDKILK